MPNSSKFTALGVEPKDVELGVGLVVSTSGWFCCATLADAWYRQILDVQCRALRKACRSDRDAHISALADQIETSPQASVFDAVHRILCHRRKKPYQPEPLPRLLQADGSVCRDVDEVRTRWREHVGALEAGSDTSLNRPPRFGCHADSCCSARMAEPD